MHGKHATIGTVTKWALCGALLLYAHAEGVASGAPAPETPEKTHYFLVPPGIEEVDSDIPEEWDSALAYEARDEWTNAWATWEALHQSDPSDPLPPLRMAISLLHDRRPDEAMELLATLRKRFQDHHTIAHLLGVLYWQQGHSRHAWRTIIQSAAAADAPAETRLMLAWMALEEGWTEEAVGWVRRALETQSPAGQRETLALTAFEALHEHDTFQMMLADLNLSLDDAKPAQRAETQVPAIMGHNGRRHQPQEPGEDIPSVSMRLDLGPTPRDSDVDVDPHDSIIMQLRQHAPTEGVTRLPFEGAEETFPESLYPPR